MSKIPSGFCGVMVLKKKEMTLAEAILEARDGYERWFQKPAEICYVRRGEFEEALGDEEENGCLAEACSQIQVMPVRKGLISHHVWAGSDDNGIE